MRSGRSPAARKAEGHEAGNSAMKAMAMRVVNAVP